MKIEVFLAGSVNAIWNQTWQTEEPRDNNSVYEWHELRVKLNYWETKYYCDSLGGGYRLPTPTNEVEDAIISAAQWRRGTFFIGIAQEIEEVTNEFGVNELDGVFEGEWPLEVQYEGGDWYNIYTGEKITFSRWFGQDAGGQPDNGHHKGNEHYAVMSKYEYGQWFDTDIDGDTLGIDDRETTMCMRKCTDNSECTVDSDLFLYTTTTDFVTSTWTTTTTTQNISNKCEAGSLETSLTCADGYYCDNAIIDEGIFNTITLSGTCKMCPESSESFCKSQYFLRSVFKLFILAVLAAPF